MLTSQNYILYTKSNLIPETTLKVENRSIFSTSFSVDTIKTHIIVKYEICQTVY